MTNKISHAVALGVAAVCFSMAASAAQLQGQLKQYGMLGEPLSGVTVSAKNGSQARTDRAGRFVLDFPGMKGSERVVLSVKKPGWSVINPHVLMAAPASDQPLEIILAPEHRAPVWQELYYRVKTERMIEDSYRQYVADTVQTQDGQLSLSQRQRLQQDYQIAVSSAARLARQLAQAEPGKGSLRYLDGMRLYLNEGLDAALTRLDEETLFGSVLLAESEEETRVVKIESSKALQLRANLLNQAFRADEAEVALKKAALLTPENFETWFAHGAFFHEREQYQRAETYYLKAIKLAQKRQDKTRPDEADATYNLALLYHARKQPQQADKTYQRALHLQRQLAEHNQEYYLVDVALTLYNYGTFKHEQGQSELTREYLAEALQIFEGYHQDDPETFAPYLQQVQNSLDALTREKTADQAQQ